VIFVVRKTGIRVFLLSLGISIVGGWSGISYDLWRFKPFGWLLAVPVAFAMIGLGQAATGVPFQQLASRWDSLQGWQRGVLGLTIVLVFAALLFGVLAAGVMSGVI
jgi:hypothetical protein